MSNGADTTGTAFWTDADDEVALERYRTLVNTVDDGIYQLDADGRFVAVNDVIVEMTGYPREELVGEPVSLLLSDDAISHIRRTIADRLATDADRNETFEFEAHTADGGTISCELRLSLLVEEGTFRGTVGVVRDVSDRKRTERTLGERDRELERERDLTDRILETSPVGITVLDDGGDVTRMNERARAQFDAPGDDSAPDSPLERPTDDESGAELPADEHPIAHALATGDSISDRVVQLEGADGRRRWLSVDVAPILTDEGDIDRVVATSQDVTALKERERRLERRTDELSTELEEIFGRITDGFYSLDADWTFTYLNERAADLIDVDDRGLEGATIWEEFEWAVDSELEARYREAMETQEPTSFELYYPDPLDSWFEIHAYPSETGLSVYFRDVTERKEREQQLEQSERRHRTLAESFPNGIVTLFDADLTYTLAAGQAFADVPVDPDDLEGRSVRDAWDEATADALEPAFRAALEGEERTVELSYADREWVVRVVPIVDDGGDVFAGMTMAQDVTERTAAERRLRERERELERYKRYTDDVLNAVDDIFYVVDETGTYQRWNESMREATGYSDEEIASSAPLEFVAAEDRAAIADGIAEIFETGSARVEATVVTKDGDRIPYEFVASALEDPAGNRVLAGIGRDVTEREEKRRELEATVEQLEESNRRLEQFAYAASHDLQEPLRMVSSYLQLLEGRYEDALDEDGREFLEYAVDGADRMREMIRGLLEYSRVETQGDPLERVELEEVFADALETLQLQIEESGAEITAEPLPRVLGDAGQLRQLFQNLLSNAITYSGDDPPRVHVAAERVGSRWTVSVRDEGIGIDPDDADRIFEVFQRLHARDEHSGTGIGLALCERIVERHGGEIRVESEPGEGATFSFTLPAADAG